jgi:hypothetical protein
MATPIVFDVSIPKKKIISSHEGTNFDLPLNWLIVAALFFLLYLMSAVDGVKLSVSLGWPNNFEPI